MNILEAYDLTKFYGTLKAVKGISFAVREGEVFGLLGPNGAGKATTINMLIGLARPTRGRILYFGRDYTHNIKKAQYLMGIVPDESNLYPELTGFENLCFCGALYGLRKAERRAKTEFLLQQFGLKDVKNKKFAEYSKGMKRRLAIAASIIHDPPILFLDEPTTGIDVASARHIRSVLKELNKKGTAIFLTTHYIEEAERLCDRVAFIVKGKIIKIAYVEELIYPIKDRNILILTLSGVYDGIEGKLSRILPDLNFKRISDNEIRMESANPFRTGHIIHILEEEGIEVIEVKRMHASLEDVFVKVTGIEAQEMKRKEEKQTKEG